MRWIRCPHKPPNWRTGSRAMPRRCADIISRRVDAQGRYWLVGDVANTPGRSLFVRLKGPVSGKGAAGKWTEYVALLVMLRRSR